MHKLSSAGIIRTERLELVSATVESFRAEMSGRSEFAGLLQAVVPDGWPDGDYREALPQFLSELEGHPEMTGWSTYYWVAKGDGELPRMLIGGGGFRGGPSADGTVEIGYGVLGEFRGHGYATEAVFALVAHAFGHDAVHRIIADTGHDNEPSRRLLAGIGFRPIGEGAEPGTGRWELPRALFAARVRLY